MNKKPTQIELFQQQISKITDCLKSSSAPAAQNQPRLYTRNGTRQCIPADAPILRQKMDSPDIQDEKKDSCLWIFLCLLILLISSILFIFLYHPQPPRTGTPASGPPPAGQWESP